MLTLCGFAASNYYNKVKLALLEKGVPFDEELAWVGQTDKAWARCPTSRPTRARCPSPP